MKRKVAMALSLLTTLACLLVLLPQAELSRGEDEPKLVVNLVEPTVMPQLYATFNVSKHLEDSGGYIITCLCMGARGKTDDDV